MKKILLLTLTGLLIISCRQKEEEKRESVLDMISHVEDSIHYRIDSLPMLCGKLKMKGQFADIGDCKLYYEMQGKGIPMVLINGGPGGTHHYFHPWFGRAKKYAQVIYYDQRGCGQSDFNPGERGYSFEQAVSDLDKLRQELGIDKWIVCGYSYGGALAQFYSMTYPEHTAGMVLIGASPCLPDDEIYQTRQFNFISDDEYRRIRDIYALYHKGEITFQQMLYNKEINGDWKRQSYYKPSDEKVRHIVYHEWVNDKNFNAEVGTTMSRYNFRGVFDGNPVPTLICEGKWDLTWGEQKAGLFKQNHPNARQVTFENSGHEVFSEEPDLFFATLKAFVTSLQPVSGSEIDRWKQHAAKVMGPQKELFAREDAFAHLIKTKGIDEAEQYYTRFKQDNPQTILFSEDGLNNVGYMYLRQQNYPLAIKIFEMNAQAYPASDNVYDSLGEAYMKSGDKKKAIENYEKALQLNPGNKTAQRNLQQLKG